MWLRGEEGQLGGRPVRVRDRSVFSAATRGPSAGTASFGQILGAAKAPPKTRFDFISAGQTSVVSIYRLPDGTFMCFGGSGAAALDIARG